MTPPTNGILYVLIAVVALIAGAGIALMFARKRDPERAATIAEALAIVARAVSSTMTDAEIKALASWIYDNSGVSKYYSRTAWIEFCLRLVPRTVPVASLARAMARRDELV